MMGALMTVGHFYSSESCFQYLPPIMALFLSLINIVFSYVYLPETLPHHMRVSKLN